MKSKLVVVGLVAALLAGTLLPAGAGRARAAVPAVPLVTAAHTPPRIFEKAQFLLDAGIAAFCIHYVFKHYQRGDYSSGASNRIRNIATAAAALLIAYNRLKAADKVAHKSKSKTLHTLAVPLDLLVGHTQSEYNRLHNGQFSGRDISALSSDFSKFTSLASSGGYAIHDVATTIPSR